MTESSQRGLTRRDFDAVIRRAAELASSEPDGSDRLSEAELFRIAREVGLSDAHVRKALAEIRTGGGQGGVLERVFGAASVSASRTVPGSTGVVAEKLDEFLVASQLLQRVRRTDTLLQYRPAVDWASHLARTASLSSRRHFIQSARSVEIRFEAGQEEAVTQVDLLVEPGTRSEAVGAAVAVAGVTGVASGVGVTLALATFAPLALALLGGATIMAGVGGSVVAAFGRRHKRRIREALAEVEGVLDDLESGSSLEPPPSSWRRWVKRHFHGVARDFLRE